MIDLHCHFLPGVDDGARDLPSALELARAAYDNGVRLSVLTPHVYPGRWDNTLSSLTPKFEAFRQAVEAAGIPLELRLGGEVHLLPECLALLEQGDLPTIGSWEGRRVVLLEFPDAGIPVGAMNAVEFLLRRGCVPMLAHPERNKGVMRSLDKLQPFVDAGCLVQLTAASVCGWFGPAAHRSALEILDAGWTTVVATDSHNLKHRPPVLAQARDVLAARYGVEGARVLTETHPMRVVTPDPMQVVAAAPQSAAPGAGPIKASGADIH